MADNSLTILQILPALDGGGVERGTLEVANEVVRRGHRSLVISAQGRMIGELTAGGSRHISMPIGRKSPLTLALVSRLRHFLSEHDIDILHVRSRLPAWIAYLAWRSLEVTRRPRFITTVHGLYSPGPYSSIMTRGERVIAVSETVRSYILQHYPRTSPDAVVLIHRGTDPEQYRYGFQPSPAWLSAWYGAFPQTRHSFLITLPGRLSRLKGHELLVDLLAALNRKKIPVQGLVVGDDGGGRKRYAQELRRRAQHLGIKNVVFAGHRTDMREIYAISDLVLSLSTKPESFGRTVLEALSIGRPVIGFDHGGVGEILSAVYPWGRVSVSDFAELMDKVVQAINHPPPVPASHPFTLDRMLDQTLALYDQLGKARRAGQ